MEGHNMISDITTYCEQFFLCNLCNTPKYIPNIQSWDKSEISLKKCPIVSTKMDLFPKKYYQVTVRAIFIK